VKISLPTLVQLLLSIRAIKSSVSLGTSITGAYVLAEGALASATDLVLLAASVHGAWVVGIEIGNDSTTFGIGMGGKSFTPGTWHLDSITIVAGTTVTLDGDNIIKSYLYRGRGYVNSYNP
jgi:hypothetical protein